MHAGGHFEDSRRRQQGEDNLNTSVAPRIKALAPIVAVVFVMTTGSGQAFQEMEQITQNAGPNIEASIISKYSCNGSNENNAGFWVYRYTARQGFRVISPPNWGSPIGGRDFGSGRDAGKVLTQACSKFCTRIYPDEDAATAKQAMDEHYRKYTSNPADLPSYNEYMCHKGVLEYLQKAGGS